MSNQNEIQNENEGNIFFQPPREAFLIRNSDGFRDISLRAASIGWDAAESEKQVIVCMMHTPTAAQLADLTTEAVKSGRPAAILGGHLGLMMSLVRELSSRNIQCFEAKSERVSEEVIQPDGSVLKTSKFVYGGLRPLV